MKNILFAASEAVPFCKTGGLADVVGSLPKSLDKDQYDVRVILPKYACLNSKYPLTYMGHFYMDFDHRQMYVGYFESVVEGIHYYFIDDEEMFGTPYIYSHDAFYEIRRFSFFSKAVLCVLPVIGFKPDIIHCHDWQTGLIPVYLHERFNQQEFYWHTKTVMTIHNLKFQGRWNIIETAGVTGLPLSYFGSGGLEAYGDANLLKGGLVFADAITTVSPSYAQEIKNPFFGEGLDGLLRQRSWDLRGIVNGIDTEDFDSEKDVYIPKKYSAATFRKDKRKNKLALQKELGLPEDEKVMMIGIVSRLTDQKGFDLISAVMEEIVSSDAVQLVVLGTGEKRYEDYFKYLEKHKNVRACITYSEALSHKIYAASDAFLMPSLFEPCGLSQLMALRYGTLPIVRETGGLKDTVEPYNEFDKCGTGFSFRNYNAHEMMSTLRYAEHIFYDKKVQWNKMVERAMKKDFSWRSSADQYAEMYDWLCSF